MKTRWLRAGWTLNLAVLWFLSPTAADTRAPAASLPGALNASAEERIFCNACSVLRPHQIPVHLQDLYTPIRPRCGTGAVLEAVQNWDRLSTKTRAKLTTFFQRPSAQRAHVSPSGNFMIHYDVSGFHAVDTADADADGVPDYVEFAATTFDDVWVQEIGSLGYREPVNDGDGIYDVHIQQLGVSGVYGLAFPAAGDLITSSYIQIDNNFTDSVYQTRGKDGVQVTAAHEFFHAIQFAYFASFDAAWWQELTAVWMEDVIYDDINDYYQYQRFFFESPETALDESPFVGYQPFAASVFGHYLADVYNRDVIRDTWESLASRTPLSYEISDIDNALTGGFPGVLPRFIVWNYMTGSRHQVGYYEEGAVYTEIIPRRVTPTPGFTVSGSVRIDHLSSAYISIDTGSVGGGLQVTFSLEDGSTYEIVMMLFKGGLPEVVSLKGESVTIANVSQYDKVVFAPISTSTSGKNFDVEYAVNVGPSFTLTSDKVGDFDWDGSVAFADFLSFAGSFGKPATHPGHDWRHDLNADGEIGFGDFLLFASHFGE